VRHEEGDGQECPGGEFHEAPYIDGFVILGESQGRTEAGWLARDGLIVEDMRKIVISVRGLWLEGISVIDDFALPVIRGPRGL
jgi:hypothetical protein